MRCYIRALQMRDGSTQQAHRGEHASPEHAHAELHALTSRVSEHAVFSLDAKGCVDTWNEGAEKALSRLVRRSPRTP